uniref:Membrane dipeptidase n=1 Tax=candidate division WOR-3 bacterium TaxID=2052148 RepID=A0A7C4YID3_UNCW3
MLSGKNRFVIDLHSDFLHCIKYGKKCVTSPENLKDSPVKIQFFAIFLLQREKNFLMLARELKSVVKLMKENNMFWGRDLNEIIENIDNDKVIGIPAIEGAEILDIFPTWEWVLWLGVRYITITWNFSNRFADAALDNEKNKGLSIDGRNLLRWMDSKKIIADVSHISEKSFKYVIDTTSLPVIASHSNAYSLCEHPRNLKDYQIKEIADTGGTIGVNFCKTFLGEGGSGLDLIVNHIKYISNLVGTEFVSIGSDFDGSKTPDDMKEPKDFLILRERLRKEGFSEKDIENIFFNNVLRIIKEIKR